MTRPTLLTLLATVAALTLLPADASAYYHPGMGRFISRDPVLYRAGDPNLYRYVGNRPTNARDPSGLKIVKFSGCTAAEKAALRAADAAVAARLPVAIAQLNACKTADLERWAKANGGTYDQIRGATFNNYGLRMVFTLMDIQRGQASGFKARCRPVENGLASCPEKGGIWGYFENLWINFDDQEGEYFALPPTLPMGTGIVRGDGSQASVLLHDLSHKFASTDDRKFNWLPPPAGAAAAARPGVAGAGNPTRIPYSAVRFSPSIAARDAWFVELFQDNSAASIHSQWIYSYLSY